MPKLKLPATLTHRTKTMLKYAGTVAVALLLLVGACSGPRLGGLVERSAFSKESRTATGLAFVRSIRTGSPSLSGGARPSDVLVLPTEELVAVDEDRGRAAKFTMDGRFLLYLEAPGAFRATDAALGPGISVYLLDSMQSMIYRFDATGQVAGRAYFDDEGSQFVAMCFDKTGAAYISDRETDEVVVMDAGVGVQGRYGGFGSGRGLFIDPAGLAVDERDRLYVCDSGNARIQVLDRWGAVLAVWTLSGEECTPRPVAVAVDKWGNAFVTDSGCNCLRVIDAAGAETFRLEGAGPGLGFTQSPSGLDVHGESLYVADQVEGAIQVFGIVYDK